MNADGFWNKDNNANNASGFSGRPGGMALVSAQWFFSGMGTVGNWWEKFGGHLTLDGNTGGVGIQGPSGGFSYSIRCVKGNYPSK